MDKFKTLLEMMIRLIGEAEMYSELVKRDDTLHDLYYTLSSAHLDMASKVKMTIASYLNKVQDSDEKSIITSTWMTMKDVLSNMCDKIKEKLM